MLIIIVLRHPVKVHNNRVVRRNSSKWFHAATRNLEVTWISWCWWQVSVDGLLENHHLLVEELNDPMFVHFLVSILGNYHFCLISFWDFMDLYRSLSNALSLSAYINITLLYLYNINWIALYYSVYSHQGPSIFTFKREVNRSTACRCSCQSTGEPPPPKTANLCEWYHLSIERYEIMPNVGRFPLYIHVWTYTTWLGQGC